jgi:two-component system chemotaxis response regulator CheB
MAIKKLIKDKFPTTSFILNENDALLMLTEGIEQICLYLKDISEVDELTKLLKLDDIKEFRFIGDERLFNSLQNMNLNWPMPSRKIFTNVGQEVIYYSNSGKVRFKKTSTFPDQKKKVLIVDDSKTIQKLLAKIIGESNNLEIAGVAGCPSEAKKIIESSKIDLITLDIHMPEMNGVDFLKSYLSKKKIPTVMISSVSMNEGPLVMEALSSGASTYIQKPSIDKLSELQDDILEKLEAVSSISKKERKKSISIGKSLFNQFDGLIAIGSSTGGTQALQEIFTSLPNVIPPIVVVQHIPAVFSKALADRLNTLCAFEVKEAEDGEFLKKNHIYIAPGGKQMKILKRGQEKRISITDDPPLNRFQPSVDYLFNSLPSLEEPNLLGIILTGMGKDGARGLLKLRESGAFTIAQDEESSIVFGMPKEAIALGAAMKIISLDEMANNIVLEFNKFIKNSAA